VNIYVCRARHGGAWIPGQLIPSTKKCHVSLLTRVFEYPKYEVLLNVEGGAKLTWMKWDRFFGFPKGAISGGSSFYVARRVVDDAEENSVASRLPDSNSEADFSHYLGKFNPDDGLGKVYIITKVDILRYFVELEFGSSFRSRNIWTKYNYKQVFPK